MGVTLVENEEVILPPSLKRGDLREHIRQLLLDYTTWVSWNHAVL